MKDAPLWCIDAPPTAEAPNPLVTNNPHGDLGVLRSAQVTSVSCREPSNRPPADLGLPENFCSWLLEMCLVDGRNRASGGKFAR